MEKVRTPVLARIAAAVCLSIVAQENSSHQGLRAQESEAFILTGNMTQERAEHQATRLANGRVLITGGQGPGGVLVTAELYDPSSGTFSRTGDMLAARGDHSATLLGNDLVLVVGGGSAELYDPGSEMFRATLGRPLVSRNGHTATLLGDGRVLIAGGSTWPTELGATTELYDPATETFTQGPEMSIPRHWHTATRLLDGSVLVTGGRAGTLDASGTSSTAEIYTVVTSQFEIVGAMADARARHSATLLNDGRVLVAGGETVNFAVLQTAELYDLQTRAFGAAENMGRFRAAHTATKLNDGRILLTAGVWAGDSAEIYDPAAAHFSLTDSPAHPREEHTATLLVDGRVLVAGGFDYITPGPGPSGETATAELYRSTPLNPSLVLDHAHSVSMIVDPAIGATLETVGADGTQFSLTIPPNAFFTPGPLELMLTPVIDIGDHGLSANFVAAAHLEPEGLQLFRPATLMVTVPPDVPLANTMGLAYRRMANGTHFTLPTAIDPTSSTVTFSVFHFSGTGFGLGSCEVPALLDPNIAGLSSIDDIAIQNLTCVAVREGIRQFMDVESTGWPPEIENELHDILLGWFDAGVLPPLGSAGDPASFERGIARAAWWAATVQSFNLDPRLFFQGQLLSGTAAANQSLSTALAQLEQSCVNDPDVCHQQQHFADAFADGVRWIYLADRLRTDLFPLDAPDQTTFEATFCNGLTSRFVTTVDVAPADVKVWPGESVQLTATLRNARGEIVPDMPDRWSAADPVIAVVDGQGLVTGGAIGTTTITAHAGCDAVGTATVNVVGLVIEPEVFLLAIGESLQLNVTRSDGGAVNSDLKWGISDPQIATISADGLVSARGLGSATVTVRRVGGPVADTASLETFVNVPDAGLNAAIRSALHIEPTFPITRNVALSLVSLDAWRRGIRRLDNLEYFTNLQSLHLTDNPLRGIGQVGSLINLRELGLARAGVSDLAPLAALDGLQDLILAGNRIRNVDVLANLVNLRSLSLSHNPITNLDPVSGLTQLTVLDITALRIPDLRAIAGLTQLQTLQMQGLLLPDAGPLAALTNLRTLNANQNRFTNAAPLSGLVNLMSLDLANNRLESVAPLSNLTRLKHLDLSYNEITDVGALVANGGIGAGDRVLVEGNNLMASIGYEGRLSCGTDRVDCSDVRALRSRVPNLTFNPQYAVLCRVRGYRDQIETPEYTQRPTTLNACFAP